MKIYTVQIWSWMFREYGSASRFIRGLMWISQLSSFHFIVTCRRAASDCTKLVSVSNLMAVLLPGGPQGDLGLRHNRTNRLIESSPSMQTE